VASEEFIYDYCSYYEEIVYELRVAQSKGIENIMLFAIPLAEEKLCSHFGHCEQFALVDVDPNNNQILGKKSITPPPHEPGLLPRWLAEQGVKVVIAGGMGQHAQSIFAAQGITVITGAPVGEPESIVSSYLEGTLVTGSNTCDH
jgi:predicted Fe-Mo cluster-binding NifX family protein